MYRMLRNAVYAAYLVLFTAYAVSPVYADAHPGKGNDLHSRANVRMGILSVKVVLSSLIGEQRSDPADAGSQLSSASQDDELLLVHKKRCIVRHSGDSIKPLLQTATLLSGTAGPETAFPRAYSIPADPIHQGSDGFRHYATGLSPPFSLS